MAKILSTAHVSLMSQNTPLLPSYTSVFYPYFLLLHYIGRAPISAKITLTHELPFKKIIRYGIKYSICSVIVTGMFQAAWITLTACFINNTVFNSPIPFHVFPLSNYLTRHRVALMSPLVHYIMSSMDVILAINSFVDHFISCWKSVQFGRYLNGWNEIFWEMDKFSRKTLHYSPTTNNFKNLISFRNKLFTRLTLMAISFTFMVASSPEVSDIMTKYYLMKVFRVLFVAGGPILYLVDDGKFLLLFKMSEHAFEQILIMAKEKASNRKEKWDSERHLEIMKQLTIITIKVRERCCELGKYTTAQMLLSLAGVLYYTTGAFFVVVRATLHLIQHGSIDPETMFPLVFAIFCLCRYWIIINGASKITEQERKLAKFLKELEIEFPDQQTKCLHDLIIQNPTEISLSGYVTLNEKLVLGVLSQILTQIIIFLQFDK